MAVHLGRDLLTCSRQAEPRSGSGRVQVGPRWGVALVYCAPVEPVPVDWIGGAECFLVGRNVTVIWGHIENLSCRIGGIGAYVVKSGHGKESSGSCEWASDFL